MSINVYKNGKLRWRSSSKTSEELLEEERQRRAEQEAQTANTQSQLAGFGNTTSPAATVPKQAVITRTNNRAFSQQEKNQLKKYNLTALLTLSPEEIQELLERSQRRKNNK